MSSVTVDLDTYVFTAITSGLLTVIAIMCLLVSAFRHTEYYSHSHWTSSSLAYDWLLATVAVVLATAIRWRLDAMELVTEQMAAAIGYVDLTPVFRIHVTCVSCAAVMAAAALLRLTKPLWPSSKRLSLATVNATTAAAVVSIYYFLNKPSRGQQTHWHRKRIKITITNTEQKPWWNINGGFHPLSLVYRAERKSSCLVLLFPVREIKPLKTDL